MANHKSAEKRARQNVKRRARNQGLRTKARTETKKALELIKAAASKTEALAALIVGEKALRKAASKGVFPKERASRKISRLAEFLNQRFSS